MGLFEKVFYNMLSEDVTTDVLASGTRDVNQLTASDDYAEGDDRIPFIYGPDNKKKKKNKKKNDVDVFRRPDVVSYSSGKVNNESAKAKRKRI